MAVATTYPRFYPKTPHSCESIHEEYVKTWGDAFYCFVGGDYRNVVRGVHAYVMGAFASKWRDHCTAIDPQKSTIGDLTEKIRPMAPLLGQLQSLKNKIDESASSRSSSWASARNRGPCFKVAYAVHWVVASLFNWVAKVSSKKEVIAQKLEECMTNLPWVSLGRLKGSGESLRLSRSLEKSGARGCFNVNLTKLRLDIGESTMTLENTVDGGLVVSMGQVERSEARRAMRIALELLSAPASNYQKVWLKYSGDFNFTQYGFQEPGHQALPLSQGSGDKWMVFSKEALQSSFEAIDHLEPALPILNPPTWQHLISSKPLLEIKPNTDFFKHYVLRSIPYAKLEGSV